MLGSANAGACRRSRPVRPLSAVANLRTDLRNMSGRREALPIIFGKPINIKNRSCAASMRKSKRNATYEYCNGF